jgi:hypothetical protein
MPLDIGADQILQASVSPRWSALTTVGGIAADLQNYDAFLLRDPRLLVPVDVQALVVRAGVNDTETMVRLPFRTDDPGTYPPLDVHDVGAPRPPGVHLLWTTPDALGRGRIVPDPAAPDDATRRRLQLPVLPDRWVVVRLVVPAGGSDPTVAGWVIDAAAGSVTPLAEWPATTTSTQAVAPPVPGTRLDVHAGGTSWTLCYDAAIGRLSFYDPLTDLAGVQIEGDAMTYLVAGWWSASDHDPLNGIGSDIAYYQRLADLGWNDVDHPSAQQDRRSQTVDRYRAATTFGLTYAGRYTQAVSATQGKVSATQGLGLAETAISGYVAPGARALNPASSGFLNVARQAALLAPAPTQSTLLHGRIHGVPLNGALGGDGRPAEEAVALVLGSSTPEVAGVVASARTGIGSDDTEAGEQLLAAFTAGLVMQLDQADTWADVDDFEHTHEFGSLPGGTEGVDRFVDKPSAPVDPGSGFRAGQTAVTPSVLAAPLINAETTILWSPVQRPQAAALTTITHASQTSIAGRFDGRVNSIPQLVAPPADQVREVARPAPRYQFPAAPVLAVVGGGREQSAVEREEADGTLMCRLSDQTSQGHDGVLAAADLLASLGSGAVPDEVLDLAREALSEDPYLVGWRTRRATPAGFNSDALLARFRSEAALSYCYYAADNDRIGGYLGMPVESAAERQRTVEGLLRPSLSKGVWAHPEGVTMWGQPWRPLFCDWEVTVDLVGLTGWALSGGDLDPLTHDPPTALALPVTISGRSPLVAGAASTLSKAIDRWLAEERQRDLGGHALATADTEDALARLGGVLATVDLLSVTLDGIREQLLGLEYDRGLVHHDANALPDGTRRAVAMALPQLLAAGRLSLTSARLVDAFGRLLELPVGSCAVSARRADGNPGALRLRPRLTAPSRWRFDLVDALSTSADAALAGIDQADPTKQVTPIAGFLLPDHMDESLEVFAADGTPLGELLHDPFSDAVSWEIAPGRTDVPPAAGPADDPDVSRHRIGWVAAGLVAADATSRQATPNRPETESALSAMLRAIDTTLWTVDPFGSLGREHIAGLVGRPIAVVAARLSLDIASDVGDRTYPPDSTLQAGRQDTYDALPELEFEVRLGELTRSDDGLLGYFIGDDYTTFHLVDRSIATEALPSGRLHGVLADDGSDPTAPVEIRHPYVDDSGVVRIHPGQTIRLTLLMHPGGKVYLTSGVLPRTQIALARDWIDPGLSRLAPSLRSGPLLIDADKVRLPKVASFPADQLFTHRDTPTTWKDDPILAATQSALLPDQSPEIQEGWVRINPNPSRPAGGT